MRRLGLLAILLFIATAIFAAPSLHFGIISAVKKSVVNFRNTLFNKNGFKLKEHTRVVTPNTDKAFVSETGGQYRYSKSATEISEWRPSDVIISAAGAGYLLKVESVSDFGGEWIVQTSPTTMENAFEEADIHITKVLSPGDVATANVASGVRSAVSAGQTFSFNVNKVLYDDGAGQTLELIGNIEFGVTLDYTLRIKNGVQTTAKMIVTESSGLQLVSGWGGSIDQEVKLGTYTFAPILVGGVVVLVPSVDFVVGAKAAASVKVTAELNQSFEAISGLEYAGGVWTPLWSQTHTENYGLLYPTAAGSVKFWAGSKAKVKLWNVTGPAISVLGYSNVGAALNAPNFDWDVCVGVQGKASYETSFLGFIDYKAEVSLFDSCLANWSGSYPQNSTPTFTATPNAVSSATPTLVVATVALGEAENFTILSRTGISAVGSTSIVGNVGVSPADASYITGFGLISDTSNQFSTSSLVNGRVYASDYSVPTPASMTSAIADMQAAYTDAAGRAPNFINLGAGTLSGSTLPAGVYYWSTDLNIMTDITLSGSASEVWIFQIAGTLDIASGVHVNLSGGAETKNIFWQVAGQATLNSTSIVNGNILGQTAIVLNPGATLNGKALAQTAVTLSSSQIVSEIALTCDCQASTTLYTLDSGNMTWSVVLDPSQIISSFPSTGLNVIWTGSNIGPNTTTVPSLVRSYSTLVPNPKVINAIATFSSGGVNYKAICRTGHMDVTSGI